MSASPSLLDFADADRKKANAKSFRPHSGRHECPFCRAPMLEYKHSLSKQLGEILVQLYRFGRPARVRDLHLSYGKASNFQKLRYFGLLSHDSKGAVWSLTAKGEQFVRGTIRVNRWAWSYRGEVVELAGPMVLITDLVPDFNWRVDYAKEAREHAK